jgi:hypothetical protein
MKLKRFSKQELRKYVADHPVIHDPTYKSEPHRIVHNEYEMYSKEQLENMIIFYRKGPLNNKQCRIIIIHCVKELRSRK